MLHCGVKLWWSFCLDGDPIALSKGNTFMGHHLLVPKEGVAVLSIHTNFSDLGYAWKIAVNLLAGMPAVVKPATVTSFLTSGCKRNNPPKILPGREPLQLICGSAGNMLDYVGSQDVVTFTGSASTGLNLRSHAAILKENVPFNMEADSLNCIVLGEDVQPGKAEWDIFVKEVKERNDREGWPKCTAIRRIFVPWK